MLFLTPNGRFETETPIASPLRRTMRSSGSLRGASGCSWSRCERSCQGACAPLFSSQLDSRPASLGRSWHRLPHGECRQREGTRESQAWAVPVRLSTPRCAHRWHCPADSSRVPPELGRQSPGTWRVLLAGNTNRGGPMQPRGPAGGGGTAPRPPSTLGHYGPAPAAQTRYPRRH